VRLGLLGGSFDPIHLGHLRAAENAREALQLDRVLLVPAARPPHKPDTQAPGWDRFAMACLATAGHPAFLVSDLELRREPPSYTVDTLERLAAERPADELWLIVGSDTLADVGGWRSSARVFELARVAVVTRPGVAPGPAPAGARVDLAPGPALEVSSSQVRDLLRAGRSTRYLIPDTVADYVLKRGLYR
jgi:nicotinate-nucleotide adenylyltransferase